MGSSVIGREVSRKHAPDWLAGDIQEIMFHLEMNMSVNETFFRHLMK